MGVHSLRREDFYVYFLYPLPSRTQQLPLPRVSIPAPTRHTPPHTFSTMSAIAAAGLIPLRAAPVRRSTRVSASKVLTPRSSCRRVSREAPHKVDIVGSRVLIGAHRVAATLDGSRTGKLHCRLVPCEHPERRLRDPSAKRAGGSLRNRGAPRFFRFVLVPCIVIEVSRSKEKKNVGSHLLEVRAVWTAMTCNPPRGIQKVTYAIVSLSPIGTCRRVGAWSRAALRGVWREACHVPRSHIFFAFLAARRAWAVALEHVVWVGAMEGFCDWPSSF
jgi:hypothetical protein